METTTNKKLTAAHRHAPTPKPSRIVAWTTCVSPPCNGASHGATVRIETYRCGSERRTEINGKYSKRGIWS